MSAECKDFVLRVTFDDIAYELCHTVGGQPCVQGLAEAVDGAGVLRQEPFEE